MIDEKNLKQIYRNAQFIMDHPNLFPTIKGMEYEDIIMLLISVEEENEKRNELTDSYIDYNDEIVEIEELGEKESMDISVTGDNLFYANGILTKNSFGLPATLDFYIAITETEELTALNQYLVKQLKNRFGDQSKFTRFVIGVDKPKMRIFDVEESRQNDIMQDTPVMDRSHFGKQNFEKFK